MTELDINLTDKIGNSTGVTGVHNIEDHVYRSSRLNRKTNIFIVIKWLEMTRYTRKSDSAFVSIDENEDS